MGLKNDGGCECSASRGLMSVGMTFLMAIAISLVMGYCSKISLEQEPPELKHRGPRIGNDYEEAQV